VQQSINIFQHIKNLLRTNYSSILKYAAIHILMRQLYFIAALLALCSCIQFSSLVFMARSTTYESARVSVATFMCDVDECTFEGNCSKSLKRHQLTHSAALLRCDFMGCSYETKDSSHLKRHKLSHTTKVTAELTHSAALLHCDFMECSFETKYSSSLKRHKLCHTTKVAAELTHSAALLHCDFMGCSYETKESSHLKRHKLSHTKKAEKAIAKEKEMTVKCATKAEQSRACEDGNTIQFMDLSMGLETLR
jgi:hypothetical protein